MFVARTSEQGQPKLQTDF